MKLPIETANINININRTPTTTMKTTLDTAVFIPDGIDLGALEHRIEQIEAEDNGTYQQQFNGLCRELGIDADDLAGELGGRCMWGLLGYVQAAYSPEEEWD